MCEAERKKKRESLRLTMTTSLWANELRHLLNSPFPQPCLGLRSLRDEFRNCSTSSLTQHLASVHLMHTWNLRTEVGLYETCSCLQRVWLGCWHLCSGFGNISQKFVLCKTSRIFLHVLQIFLWSKHWSMLHSSYVSNFNSSSGTTISMVTYVYTVVKSLFLFKPIVETSSNRSGASSVEASLYTSAALYNLST